MISSHRRARRLTIASFVVAGLVLGACGSDDDGSDSADTAAETTAAAAPDTTAAAEEPAAADTTEAAAPDTSAAAEPAGTPIVIGALLDLTGVAAPTPFTADVLDAWAESVNAAGGLGGHPVQIEKEDTKGDAAAAQASLDALLAKDPQVIFAAITSVEAALAAPLAATGIPVIGTGFSPALWGGEITAFGLKCSTETGASLPCAPPNVFPLTTTIGAVVDMQLVAAQLVEATKVVQAACAEVEACSQSAPIFDTTAATLGLEVAPLAKISASAPDYSAECIGFIQDGVDYIQLGLGTATAAKLASDCLDQGYDGWFGASAGTASGALLAVEGIRLAGALNAFPWFADDPAAQEFRDAMDAAGVAEVDYGSAAYTGAWTALKLLEQAIETAGITADQDVAAADVLAALYGLADETLGGLTFPVTYTEGQPAPARNCFWPYRQEDGEIVSLLDGLAYECYPAEA